MEKECPAHGFFSTPVWRNHVPITEWIGDVPEIRDGENLNCPHACGLCPDHQRETCCVLLEVTGQCRVFTHYGMTETGYGGGVQCGARQAYHLRDADLLVEIVDPDTGSPLPLAQTGEVVLTTLQNVVRPLSISRFFLMSKSKNIQHLLDLFISI
jgi:hypothetical protein